MTAGDHVLLEKRLYNKWVASETLEDYALRYTADGARRWSAQQVATTAIGATAFLACEAIGAAITLTYGFANSVAAITVAVALMFVIGLPIAYQAARQGLDIDLLTRGAGFGYMGSTVTSLIYASFTFLLFSVEGMIMAGALRAMTGMSMGLAYLLSALLVIPIALYGMSAITKFQAWTQGFWIVLQLAPIGYLVWLGPSSWTEWSQFNGIFGQDSGVSLLPFGFALSTLLSLLPQIGEQADYLRFLPAREKIGRNRWWAAVLAGGPGWTLISGTKLLLGSWLAYQLIQSGASPAEASSPTAMFQWAYTSMSGRPGLALVLTGLFVIVCQLKINVTNAYAGSIAWSNFFSRVTHRHPGRVVWLVFNVMLALMLMEIGIFDTIEAVLILYATLAAGWIGALAADLMISKPLMLSPAGIEFKRAHLYDINPVGIGAMLLSIAVSACSHMRLFGELAQALAPVIGLAVAFTAAPVIALATRGRYYIARRSHWAEPHAPQSCIICENAFQPVDMAHCPMYAAPICSLCCTLEARCHDRCKRDSRVTQQAARWLERLLPGAAARHVHTPVGHFIAVMAVITIGNAVLIGTLFWQFTRFAGYRAEIPNIFLATFIVFTLLGGVIAWIVVLAHHSRRTAMLENEHHVQRLMAEIDAHDRTGAELQKAKEAAESANAAKSRYLVSVSHEIRSPLNSIYGYAQLMERGRDVSPVDAAKVIRRSAEHLTNLVEGLLDISQVESGVLRIASETVRFPPFLDQIANMFRPQAQAKGIAFHYERPAHLPDFVRTDQKRLRQILINLLSNAVKFTRTGSVALRVSYRSQMAVFEIIDTGLGITPEDLARVFEPFERGGNMEAQRQQGVGLGLSITQALVRILGGDLSVESVPGEGTCFTVRLMMGQVAGSAAVDTKAPESVSGYEGPRRKVLLIDDDETQLAVLTNLLEPLDFTVFPAQSGEAGLEIAAREQPDIVLLDISMPGESGWDICRTLRARMGPAMRIVMVSANAHEFNRGGDGQAPHDRFLMKPVDLDALLDVLADQLQIRWASDTPDPPVPAMLAGAPLPQLPPETQPILAEIERKAVIGHVRGIEASIRLLESTVPEAAPLAAILHAYLDRFDLKGLINAVRVHR